MNALQVWFWPLIMVGLVICGIALYATMKVSKLTEERQQENDTPVSNVVKNNSVTLNPVFLAYIVALVFIAFVVFYYAAIYHYK